MIEVIAGVSKRQVQRIISEEEHGDSVQDHSRQTQQRILKSEHLEVSNSNTLSVARLFMKRAHFLSVPERLHLSQPINIPW